MKSAPDRIAPTPANLAESRFRAIFESSASMMSLMDTEGRILEVNAQAIQAMNQPRADLVGKFLWETPCWSHSPEAQAFVRGAIAMAAKGEAFHGESIHPRPGRAMVVDFTLRPIQDDEGNVVQLVSEGRDITQRIETEHELAESMQKLRLVVQNAAAIIFILDRDGIFLLSEGLGLARLGLQPGQVVGQSAFEIYKDIPSVIENIRNAMEGRTSRVQNCIGAMTFDTVYSPYYNAQGALAGVVGIALDITELLAANDERHKLQTQLIQAQRMEAIGQLAGGIAHDFNNILAAMLMHLGLLQMDDTLKLEIRTALRELEEGATRAANLTRQLLTFSRRQVMQKQTLDLDSLLGNLLRMLRRIIGENIKLECPGSRGPLWIHADPGMIEQVVVNLVVNARDAMPSGGRVLIQSASCHFASGHAFSTPEGRLGHYACLSISDTGCGMDTATLQRIFEPFFTTKGEGKGTGLGLATVYGIVKRHDGWIEIDSQVDHGTTFHVYLPLATSSGIAPTPHVGPPPLARGKETILLAEDDRAVRELVVGILQKTGYRVLQATTGQQALEAWTDHGSDIDLLLTDLVMPEGLTGLELAQRLRREKPGLKVVIMSGYILDQTLDALPARERILYLPKPFESATLARTIRLCLDG
jgi:two-component system cell cycle sensor histidine kinase/response regulator CckA